MKKFNATLAVKITTAFSTMWAFYAFFIYGLTPLLWPQHQDQIMYWSNFLQLIALPALAVGSLVMGQSAEKRMNDMYDMVKEELSIAKEERQELHDLVKKQNALIVYLHQRLDKVSDRPITDQKEEN